VTLDLLVVIPHINNLCWKAFEVPAIVPMLEVCDSISLMKSASFSQNHSCMSKVFKRAKITQAYQNHSGMPKTLVGARRVSAVFNDIFSLIRQ